MKSYGIIRPVIAASGEAVRVFVRLSRAMWSQRRLEIGENVKIAPSVDCRGLGRIVIGGGTIVRKGVIIKAAEGASIEIGDGCELGEGSVLTASSGQVLRLGAKFKLGAKAAIHSVAGVEWGDNGILGANSVVGPRESEGNGRLQVGQDVRILNGALIDTCADVIIGSHVHCGPHCAWYTHNHLPKAGETFWDHGIQRFPVLLGNRIWVGHGCIFLPGVEVGNDAVIAASAVVTKAVKNTETVGGIPAKRIGWVA